MSPPPVPDWLVPWATWTILGKVGPRPSAPKRIPEWALWFPGWVKWRMGGKVGSKPPGTPSPVPDWVWLPATATIREVNKQRSLEPWRSMGVWVTRIDHMPPVWLELYGAGLYDYVVVPTLFGTQPEPFTEGLAEYVAGARERGFLVMGSQWGRATNAAEAEVEADAGAEAYKDYGFDGWAMNGEKTYEGGGKSGAYARRFRQRVGFRVPFLWTPEARLSLDHSVLQELGVAYGPQAYPLENGRDLDYCAEWARNFGYLPENTVPLVGAYPVDGVRYPAEVYRSQALANGLPAVVLYTGNQTADVPQYWRDLAV